MCAVRRAPPRLPRALDDPRDPEPLGLAWVPDCEAVLPLAADAEPEPSTGDETAWVNVGVVGVFTGRLGSEGVLTDGVVIAGVVTCGVVTCGVVTVPMLTDGTVTEGTVTLGTDTVGTPSDTVPPSAAAAGGAAETTSAVHPARTVRKERFIGPHPRPEFPLTRPEKSL